MIHFGWRTLQQGIITLCVHTAGRDNWLNDAEWDALQPWLVAVYASTLSMQKTPAIRHESRSY